MVSYIALTLQGDYTTPETGASTRRVIRVPARLDGIISMAISPDVLGRIMTLGVPIVDLSGENEDDPAFISVDHDPVKMGRMAAERFL